MNQTPPVDWNGYALQRNLGRNRLLMPHHAELVDDFLRAFGSTPLSERLLDIGPASGFFMGILRELGFQTVHGLDASPAFVERARAKNLDAFLGDIENGAGLSSLSPPYGAVSCMEVLEHLDDPASALGNIRGLLKPEGCLYVTVPVCDCIFDRLRRKRDRITREAQVRTIDETHRNIFDAQSLQALLESNGFHVKHIRRVSFQFPKRWGYSPGRRLHLLVRALFPVWTRGYCLSAIARRGPEVRP